MSFARFRSLGLALACLMTVGGGAFAQTKVRVGNVNTVSDIGIYIADKKGYFKSEGLDVEFIAFNTAARMIAPLGAGQLDVGGGTVSAGHYNAFTRKIASQRTLPPAITAVLERIPAKAHPMDVMRTGVSVLGGVLPEKDDHNHPGARDIADKLSISEHTVKVHFWRLFRRLGVNSRTQALHFARTNGWVGI